MNRLLNTSPRPHYLSRFGFPVLFMFTVLISGTVAAKEAWQKSVKPFQPPTLPMLKPCTLNYSMSWNGKIASGKATLTFGVKDKKYKSLYVARASGRSTGIAATLFPYAFSYSEFMRKGSGLPLLFMSHEVDKKGTQKVKNTYKKNRVIHQVTYQKKGEVEVKKKNHTYNQPSTLGPLSAMLYIRGRELKKGEVIHLSLYPFKSPQYGIITVVGREQHLGRPCIKLDLKLKNIDRDTMKLKDYKKMKKSTLWISDDADRILVELRSKVFIGDVRMVLTGGK